MESNTNMLFEAAKNGRRDFLERLVKENPTILADLRLTFLEESLLHVATKLGQLGFVHELLEIDPDIATELNKDGFRPLDIAVIIGNLEMVKEILRFNGNMLVRLKGKEGRTALHYAAIKGRADVIDELLCIGPDCIVDITVHEETALHLAVKFHQFDVFAVLVKWVEMLNKGSIINMGDGDGNTVIHLAVSTKQHMCIDLLLGENCVNRGNIKVNTKNAKGFTALNILDIIIQDSYDVKVRELLQSSSSALTPQDSIHDDQLSEPAQNWFKYFKFQKQRDSPSDTRNALLVVAALIATVSFQAGVNPPNWIFDQIQTPSTNTTSSQTNRTLVGPAVGSAIASTSAVFGSHATSYLFLFSNSLGLTASLCIIIYLTAGFPFQRELHISLYSMMFTYGFVMNTIIIKGTEAKKKAVAYVLVTIAFVLPFVQRWIPRLGRKAWRKWRKKPIMNNTCCL
ncbi:hypothetical protein ACJIZ3_016508 [Penstemon smallii]|uniref:PGG domain-containing protein n=1 Tax=Penstemon smallii TaxID=265156 RepID=A0ABD3RPZ1_9LAMI